MKVQYSSSQVYEIIRSDQRSIEQMTSWLYSSKGWTMIARKVLQDLGADNTEIQDIIQDGVITLFMDIKLLKIRDPNATKSYFVQMCRNIWLNKYNRMKRGKEIINQNWNHEEVQEDYLPTYHKMEFWTRIDSILDQLGRKCKEVLKLWASGYSHEEIAEKIGYDSANVSKKTKSLCIKKLKALGLKKEDWNF